MNQRHGKRKEPTIAPGMAADEAKRDAAPEEIRRGDFTPVTKLVLDRTPDDE